MSSRYLLILQDGTRRGLLTNLYVPKDLHYKFIHQHSEIQSNEDLAVQTFNPATRCQLCDRLTEDCSYGGLCVSEHKQLNKSAGRPLRICLDCHYYILKSEGYTAVPKTPAAALANGHMPTRLDKYLT